MSVLVFLLGMFIGIHIMRDGNEALYDFKKRSDESGLICKDPSLTVQADLEDSDINVIIARFNITKEMPTSVRLPEFADYEDVFDFQTAQNALIDAENQFMAMPAKVRKVFDNDPQAFFEYAINPENYDGLVELGLAKERIKEDTPAPVVTPKE
ncbi:MAG: internal scaffolding protein [Microvirus sp.]|nr:MAG: internal scaffolding protein [Microvirus sp.]